MHLWPCGQKFKWPCRRLSHWTAYGPSPGCRPNVQPSGSARRAVAVSEFGQRLSPGTFKLLWRIALCDCQLGKTAVDRCTKDMESDGGSGVHWRTTEIPAFPEKW